MEDKTFELLTKMYGDFSEFRKETNEKFNSLGNQIIRIENKLDNNSKALFDGYKLVYEEVAEVKNKVTDMSSKVEKQDVEIKVIKGGK